MAEKKTPDNYSSSSFTKLEGLAAVRMRPGMYIGTVSEAAGLHHLIWEIADNSIDEKLAGYGENVTIILHADDSIEVIDGGRGIPVDRDPKSNGGKSALLLATSELHAGSKFGGDASGYKTAGGVGGLHGVGASVVNALSTRFDAKVYRDGKEWRLSYSKGDTGLWEGDGVYGASKFTKKSVDAEPFPDNRSAAEKKARPTGTTIRFWYDKTIFAADLKYDLQTIITRAKQSAFLVHGLQMTVIDMRDELHPVEHVYKFDGGIQDMLESIMPDKPITTPIYFKDVGLFTELLQTLDDEGKAEAKETERPVEAEIAFTWGNEYETIVKSFVNIVSTPYGGTHVKGFERGISKVILDYIKNTKGMLKANETAPTLDDIREGLTAVISIKLTDPQFVGQMKQELGTGAVNAVIFNLVAENFKSWSLVKKNAASMKTIAQKVVNASRVRLAQKQQKETARKKNALEGSSSMPAKLVECSLSAKDGTELIICEGDSALGSLKMARDSRYQALMPIRGKILNVHKATLRQVLDNAECAQLIQIMGAGSGREFDSSMIRYSRVLLAADADADGSHIRSLLITLFAKYMRPVIDEGRLYTIAPPLYKVKVGGKKPEDIWVENDAELAKVLAKLEKEGRPLRSAVNRMKGLGEMDADELFETSLDPQRRVLRQITWGDVEASENVLDLAMGNDVASRKAWIQNAQVSLDGIDA